MREQFLRVEMSSPFLERMFRHGTVKNTVVDDHLPEGYKVHNAFPEDDHVVVIFAHPDENNGETRTLHPEFNTEL